ncbi:MAG: hypothetical protein J6K48_15145 [Lachnospiraceae bacterium]|nr:hypothetical protein [Lachnospiraceae bacterium]
MVRYTIVHWLFFFYIYCFFGWCFESTYVSIKSKKLVNRGFMRGPFLPLYGSGAMMMYVVSLPFQSNIVLTYIAGVIGATALEYVTGVTMETLFKVRYWDYSSKPFNFQGHICLSSSIAWGFLTILMTRVIHKPIERVVMAIPPNYLLCMTIVITVYMVADFTLSFKAAMDLRDILVKMEKAREEMVRMQRRLDVIIAFNNEEKELKRQEREERISELTAGLEQRFASLKEIAQNKPSAYGESVREEIAELRAKYNIYIEKRSHYRDMLDFYKRDMIRNNPMMASHKFKDAFEELKNAVSNRKDSQS